MITLDQQRALLEEELLANIANPVTPVTKPADLNTVIEQTQTVVTSAQAKNAEVTSSVETTLDQREQLLEELAASQAEVTQANIEQANVDAGIQTRAAARNPGAIQQYQDKVSGTRATEQRNKIHEAYIEAENAYLAEVEKAKNSNFFMRAVREELFVKPAFQEMQRADALRQNRQQLTAAATQQLFASITANTKIEESLSAEQKAEVDRKVAVATDMYNDVAGKIKITDAKLEGYRKQLGLSDDQVKLAINNMELELKKGALTQQDTQRILGQIYAVNEVDKMRKAREDYASETEYLAVQEDKFADYLRMAGREEEIGKTTFKAAIYKQGFNLKNAEVASYMAWSAATINTKDKLITAMAKRNSPSNMPTNTQDDSVLAGAQKAVATYNGSIDEEIAKLTQRKFDNPKDKDVIDEEIKQRQAAKLSLDDMNDAPRIARLMTEINRTAKQDATTAISAGVLEMSDLKEYIKQNPDHDLVQLIPSDVMERITDGTYADIDLTIKPNDAAGSVDATMDSAVSSIIKRASEQGDGTMASQLALAKQTAADMAIYYKTRAGIATRQNGMTSLDNIIIRDVDSMDSSTWFSGTKTGRKLDITNQGDILELLTNGLRRREARQRNPISASGAQWRSF